MISGNGASRRMAKTLSRRPLVSAAVGVGVGLALTMLVFVVTSDRNKRELEEKFHLAAKDRAATIKRAIDTKIMIVESIRSFYNGSVEVERDEFAEFVGPFFQHVTDIHALEWAPRVLDSDRAAWEAAAGQDGRPGFPITQWDANGRVTPASRREEYSPIYYTAPPRGNEDALGFDLASDAMRHEALLLARDSGDPVATQRVTLVQDKKEEVGFLIVLPVYRQDGPRDTVAQRRRNLRGFVVGAFRAVEIVEGVLTDELPMGIDVELCDESSPAADRLFYSHASRTRRNANASAARDDVSVLHGVRDVTICDVGQRRWAIICVPAPAFEAMHATSRPWSSLAVGLTLTALLGIYMWASAGRTAKVQHLVGQRTRELEENQRRLAELVASYAGRKAQLAGINRLFEEALNSEADEDVAKTCLAVAEELTGSKFGLIGELNAEGRLDVVALSDPGWAACRMPKTNAVVLLKDMQLRGYLGQAVVDEKSVIVNDPASHPGRVGIPDEHVPIVAFLGVPLKRAGRTIGMIALANKPGGYQKADQQAIEALSTAFVEAMDRKRVELALKRSEETYRRLLENLTDVVQTYTPDGTLLYCSPRTRDLGLPEPPDAQGVWDLIGDEEERNRVRRVFAAIAAERTPKRIESLAKRVNGEVFPIEAAIYPLVENDEVVSLQCLIHDISDRRRTEQDLIAAKRAAEEASKAKSTFLASMSHELRTPMNSILGFTNRLLKKIGGDLSQRDLDALQTVDRNARHLLGLINDILDLSKIEAGKMDLQTSRFDLSTAIQEVMRQMTPLADVKHLRLRTDLPEQNVVIRADRTKVIQVVTNLVSNGIKYTDAGSVTVALRQEDVRGLGTCARITVRDTGIGISREDQGRLFNKFTQLDTTTGRRAGGTGLGLCIARQYVEMHGGRIELADTPDKGSEFLIVLPLEPSIAVPTPPEPFPEPLPLPLEDPGPASSLHGIVVLCIDDDPDFLTFIRLTLEEAGYEVLLATDCAAAVELARFNHPDLICLDLRMPGRDGYEVMRDLRKNPELALIPVMVISITDERTKALRAGARCYLTKPVDAEHLVAAARAVLAERRAAALAMGVNPILSPNHAAYHEAST